MTAYPLLRALTAAGLVAAALGLQGCVGTIAAGAVRTTGKVAGATVGAAGDVAGAVVGDRDERD
jgi:hypothetical protein